MNPEQAAPTSNAGIGRLPSDAWIRQAVDGHIRSGVTVAQTIRSTSRGATPAGRLVGASPAENPSDDDQHADREHAVYEHLRQPLRYPAHLVCIGTQWRRSRRAVEREPAHDRLELRDLFDRFLAADHPQDVE